MKGATLLIVLSLFFLSRSDLVNRALADTNSPINASQTDVAHRLF